MPATRGLLNDQAGAGFSYNSFRFFGGRSSGGQVAHFSAGPGFDFAVKMKLQFRTCAGGGPLRFTELPEISQQIRHSGGAEHFRAAERESTDGAQLLLELAGDAGVYGQVAGVVGAGRELIDEESVLRGDEKFDAQNAGDAQLLK